MFEPSVGFCGGEDGFDDAHVFDGVLDGGGDGGVVEDGLREEFALDVVLIADGEDEFLDVGAALAPHAAADIGGSIEGDFDFDASRGAEYVDALVGGDGHGASEGGSSRAEVEDGGGKEIDVVDGVELDGGGDAPRFGVEDEAGEGDGVAADVEEASPAELGVHAIIFGGEVVVGEEGLNGFELSDFSGADEVAGSLPLGVMSIHEGFHDLQSRITAGGVDESAAFFGGESDRLFAEDVLTGFEGLDGPGDVEVIGEGVIDGVDIGIGEEFLVGAVGAGDAELVGGGAGLGEFAGGDGEDLTMLALLHGGDDFIETDFGGTEDAPTDYGHEESPFLKS